MPPLDGAPLNAVASWAKRGRMVWQSTFSLSATDLQDGR